MLLYASYFILFSLWLGSYFIIIPVSFNLIATAVCIISVGCHHSLSLTPLLHEHKVPEDTTESAEPKEAKSRETLTSADAMMFPIMGSIALFSLYCAFKYLDPSHVQLLLTAYFMLAGLAALTATFADLLRSVTAVRKALDGRGPVVDWKFTLRIPFVHGEGSEGEPIHILVLPSHVVAAVPALLINYYYSQNRHYMLNNLIGVAFCVQALEAVSLGSYKTAAMLLAGLFLYDIFWVFGTEVMVTVAKSVKGPLLLQFPRAFADAAVEGSKDEFNMLGLGDIVVPGLFVALLLRLDTTKYLQTLLKEEPLEVNKTAAGAPAAEALKVVLPPSLTLAGLRDGRYPRPYFYASLVGYVVGLILTVVVMVWFKAAQPALLYLVPCCLLASAVVGLAKGEFMSVVWEYSEEEAPPEPVTGNKKTD